MLGLIIALIVIWMAQSAALKLGLGNLSQWFSIDLLSKQFSQFFLR